MTKRSILAEHGQLMKKCGLILSKLMKHRFGYIFNEPVASLKLRDYEDIIKNPMDLGTVKSKLTNNLYDSPVEFANDIRLTFNNAMKYNPRGHEVHWIAEHLRSRFEELFKPIGDKMGEYEHELVQEFQAISLDHNQENVMPIAPRYEQIPNSVPPNGSNPWFQTFSEQRHGAQFFYDN